MPPLSVSFRRKFELHHGFCMSRVKYCAILDPNGYRQWARPSLRVFILNAAECEGLASETSKLLYHREQHYPRYVTSVIGILWRRILMLTNLTNYPAADSPRWTYSKNSAKLCYEGYITRREN